MNKRWIILDKDNVPLQDDLEKVGLIVFDNIVDAGDSLEWLIQDSDFHKFRGLRIVPFDPEKHKMMNQDDYYAKYIKDYDEYSEAKNEN